MYNLYDTFAMCLSGRIYLLSQSALGLAAACPSKFSEKDPIRIRTNSKTICTKYRKKRGYIATT